VRKLDDFIIAVCFLDLKAAYLIMSKITSDSLLARRAEQIAFVRAAAELKRTRNNEAAEREHFRLTRKVEHEFDDRSGQAGF
jgi:hypothetical protein